MTRGVSQSVPGTEASFADPIVRSPEVIIFIVVVFDIAAVEVDVVVAATTTVGVVLVVVAVAVVVAAAAIAPDAESRHGRAERIA